MTKDVYLQELYTLKELMDSTQNTPFVMWAKVVSLATMNMRYEHVAFSRNLSDHPYVLTKRIVADALVQFRSFLDIAFIESDDKTLKLFKSQQKEEKHQELFNEVWDRYDEREFKIYIDRYVHRIRVNNLGSLVGGKQCVDLGCGNGVFCFALLECGASFAAGVDYGGKSILYAQRAAKSMGSDNQAEFRQATVYETGYADNSFDFAIQNGVFHHLDDEDRAIRETARILKKGGWFWYYTDGEGGISYDLWDNSVHMLRDVSVLFIETVLNSMNVRRNKLVHLMDGMSATYAHTSWDKMTKRLENLGFGNFRRLTGGSDTDCDLDVIEADPYGREKFGEGDLRILCQLLDK